MNEKAIKNLSIAYRTEIEGYNFYITAAANVKDEHGKMVFCHLAKEELEHITVLPVIGKALEAGGGWLAYKDALGKGKHGAPIFPEENDLTKRFKQNLTEMNAVTIAMEIEEKAVNFYSGLLKEAVEPAEKAVLGKLLEMERNHFKLLRWERDALNHTGFWADFMEFSVEMERD